MKKNVMNWIPVMGLLWLTAVGCESAKDDPKPDQSLFNPDLTYGTVTDIEGNEYKTITIGAKTWMAGNLRTTKYNDSSNIKLITDDQEWANTTSPAYCYYENDKSLKQSYGILYNWYAVDSAKICPEGFHVPTDEEWTQLEIYLQNNDYNFDGIVDTDNDRMTKNNIGKALASASKWVESDYSGSVGSRDHEAYRNKSGLSVVPGGYRNYDGTFHDRGYAGYWWTDSEYSTNSAWNRYLAYDYGNVFRITYLKTIGFSVCCVMDAKK